MTPSGARGSLGSVDAEVAEIGRLLEAGERGGGPEATNVALSNVESHDAWVDVPAVRLGTILGITPARLWRSQARLGM